MLCYRWTNTIQKLKMYLKVEENAFKNKMHR